MVLLLNRLLKKVARDTTTQHYTHIRYVATISTKWQIKCQKKRQNLSVLKIQCRSENLGLGVRGEGPSLRVMRVLW